MSGKCAVIDVSVVLKWCLRDEEATPQADALREDSLAGDFVLLTPTLFDYEIANALRVAITRQRLSEQDAAVALADFAQYAIVRYDFSGIASRTFQLSGQHQRSNPRHNSRYIYGWLSRPYPGGPRVELPSPRRTQGIPACHMGLGGGIGPPRSGVSANHVHGFGRVMLQNSRVTFSWASSTPGRAPM